MENKHLYKQKLLFNVHWIILDIPGKPDKPVVKDWDKDHADLTWKLPASDGGSPITDFVIEQRDKFSTSWNKVSKESCRYYV